MVGVSTSFYNLIHSYKLEKDRMHHFSDVQWAFNKHIFFYFKAMICIFIGTQKELLFWIEETRQF